MIMYNTYYDGYEKQAEKEAKQIIKKAKLEVVDFEFDKSDWYSVCVKEKNSDILFWLDIKVVEGEVEDCDWNNYIYSPKNYNEVLRNRLQDDDDFAIMVEDTAYNYLENEVGILF